MKIMLLSVYFEKFTHINRPFEILKTAINVKLVYEYSLQHLLLDTFIFLTVAFTVFAGACFSCLRCSQALVRTSSL